MTRPKGQELEPTQRILTGHLDLVSRLNCSSNQQLAANWITETHNSSTANRRSLWSVKLRGGNNGRRRQPRCQHHQVPLTGMVPLDGVSHPAIPTGAPVVDEDSGTILIPRWPRSIFKDREEIGEAGYLEYLENPRLRHNDPEHAPAL